MDAKLFHTRDISRETIVLVLDIYRYVKLMPVRSFTLDNKYT